MKVVSVLAVLWWAAMFWAMGASLACEDRGVAAGVLVRWGPVQGCMARRAGVWVPA